MDARELAELKAVRERMENFTASTHHALQVMEQGWNVNSPVRGRELQEEAKRYLAQDAGTKFDDVTLELDRLLEVVAGIAGEVKKEADASLRAATMTLLAVSLTLGLGVLIVPTRRDRA